MANWNTNVIASDFDVNNPIDSRRDARTGARGPAIVNGVFGASTPGTAGFIEELFGGQSATVGINANEVPKMRQAIRKYCDTITNYVNNLNPTADSGVAFKGEAVKKALETYMNDVKEYSVNLTSALLAFSDKLQDVYNQWVAATESMAGTIGATSGANFQKGTKYTETQ